MSIATPAQMAAALKAAGFSGSEIPTGVAIGLAESGGNTNAHPRNTNGTYDNGVWQINDIHRDALATGNKFDLYDNAKMARIVYVQAGHSWRPWVTFWKGTYRKYMAQGMAGANNPSPTQPAPKPGPTTQNVDATGALSGITGFFTFITDVDNWIRLGQFAAGMVLLLIGLWQLTGIDAGKVASTAAKVAVLA
jgi:hypothetical protein